MSQRLPIHPSLIDPSTGEPLRAIDIIRGKILWPAIGGQDDNDGSDDTGTEDGSSGDDTEDNEPDNDNEPDDSGGTVSREEFERIKARMQAADRRASAAENKVKEFERQGQSETERLQSELQEVTTERDSLREQLQSERIANAFLANDKVTWHDPTDALAMLRAQYMEGVEIGEDGTVTGIKEAINRMAKDKKYLVNQGGGSTSTTSSGDTMNGRRKGDKGETQKAKDEELAKRMPALGRRI